MFSFWIGLIILQYVLTFLYGVIAIMIGIPLIIIIIIFCCLTSLIQGKDNSNNNIIYLDETIEFIKNNPNYEYSIDKGNFMAEVIGDNIYIKNGKRKKIFNSDEKKQMIKSTGSMYYKAIESECKKTYTDTNDEVIIFIKNNPNYEYSIEKGNFMAEVVGDNIYIKNGTSRKIFSSDETKQMIKSTGSMYYKSIESVCKKINKIK